MSERNSFSKSAIHYANKTTRKLNPHLFGVGQLQGAIAQSNPGRTLDSVTPPKQSSRSRMASGGPVLRVTLISCRRRAIADKGNLPSGFKGLQDAIARFFDLDDEDGTIAWEYRQIETRGEQGTVVKLEAL